MAYLGECTCQHCWIYTPFANQSYAVAGHSSPPGTLAYLTLYKYVVPKLESELIHRSHFTAAVLTIRMDATMWSPVAPGRRIITDVCFNTGKAFINPCQLIALDLEQVTYSLQGIHHALESAHQLWKLITHAWDGRSKQVFQLQKRSWNHLSMERYESSWSKPCNISGITFLQNTTNHVLMWCALLAKAQPHTTRSPKRLKLYIETQLSKPENQK